MGKRGKEIGVFVLTIEIRSRYEIGNNLENEGFTGTVLYRQGESLLHPQRTSVEKQYLVAGFKAKRGQYRVPREFIRDESRSLEVVLQEKASNRLYVAVVKSYGEKR